MRPPVYMFAVIFDCDGVLVDSERLSCAAWLPVLARRGIRAELAEIERFIGKSDRAVLEHFSTKCRTELASEIISEREQEYYRQARGRVRGFPGVQAALCGLMRSGVPMAVASSGRPNKIHFNLTESGVGEYFDVVCSVVEVPRGKPAPDLFELAAAKLGMPAAGCVVVEDSVFGIQAACAAQMTALGFTSSHPREQLQSAGAHATFGRYVDLPAVLAGVMAMRS